MKKKPKEYEAMKFEGGHVEKVREGSGGVDMMKIHFTCV